MSTYYSNNTVYGKIRDTRDEGKREDRREDRREVKVIHSHLASK